MGIDAIIQDVIINLQIDMKSTQDTFTPSANLPHTPRFGTCPAFLLICPPITETPGNNATKNFHLKTNIVVVLTVSGVRSGKPY